jgi:mRNA interferase YafQ
MTLLTIEWTVKFARDLKRIEKRGCDVGRLMAVAKDLAAGQPLAARHRDHQLKGKYKAYRECHVTPDWVLIYQRDLNERILLMVRTGTHAELQLE